MINARQMAGIIFLDSLANLSALYLQQTEKI